MRYKYFKFNGAPVAHNALVVDMQSKSVLWRGYYVAFLASGRTIPVTPTELNEELTEITREEYKILSRGYYTPPRYLHG